MVWGRVSGLRQQASGIGWWVRRFGFLRATATHVVSVQDSAVGSGWEDLPAPLPSGWRGLPVPLPLPRVGLSGAPRCVFCGGGCACGLSVCAGLCLYTVLFCFVLPLLFSSVDVVPKPLKRWRRSKVCGVAVVLPPVRKNFAKSSWMTSWMIGCKIGRRSWRRDCSCVFSFRFLMVLLLPEGPGWLASPILWPRRPPVLLHLVGWVSDVPPLRLCTQSHRFVAKPKWFSPAATTWKWMGGGSPRGDAPSGR